MFREEIIYLTIQEETGGRSDGGYTNDPDDPGGETKYGISKRYHPDVDIKALTQSDAVGIYVKKYWDRYQVSKIPRSYRMIYFDMLVNPGPAAAGKILQRALNHKYPKWEKLKVDGIVGVKTLKELGRRNLEHDRIRLFRIMYYIQRVIKDPKKMKFIYGWFRRSLRI